MNAVFKASDGSEHATAAKAKRHEAIVKAAKRLAEAAGEVERALGESFLTADGEHFDMHKFRSYWRVQNRWCDLPIVVEISVYPHGLSIDLDRSRNRAVVRWYEHSDRSGGSYTTHPISEMYAQKSNAEAERIRLMEENLKQYAEQVNDAKAAILGGV